MEQHQIDLLRLVMDSVNHWCRRTFGTAPKKFRVTLENGEEVRLPICSPQDLPEDSPVRILLTRLGEKREREREGDCHHSEDFRALIWYGKRYSFSPMQAIVVQKLWEAFWHQPIAEVSQDVLLRAADSESDRLRDLFRDNAAWGELIVSGEVSGTYQLSAPRR